MWRACDWLFHKIIKAFQQKTVICRKHTDQNETILTPMTAAWKESWVLSLNFLKVLTVNRKCTGHRTALVSHTALVWLCSTNYKESNLQTLSDTTQLLVLIWHLVLISLILCQPLLTGGFISSFTDSASWWAVLEWLTASGSRINFNNYGPLLWKIILLFKENKIT